MKFIVEKEVLEKTLNYLSTKPWQEVHGLITALSKVEPLEDKKED